jgi:DNA mismatch repair protein MSH2
VHGNDALYVAQHVFHTLSVIKYYGGDAATGLASCTLTRQVAESFMRDALLFLNKRIEIWQPDTRKATSFTCTKRASPGNVQQVEDMLFADGELKTFATAVTILIAKQDRQTVVGVAAADTMSKRMQFIEFYDNDSFSNLQCLMVQLDAKECVMSKSADDFQTTVLNDILGQLDIAMTQVSKSMFQLDPSTGDLERILSEAATTVLYRMATIKV